MIYVLVPAHDEASTVGLLLWKVRQLFTEFHREYQMIVVNDGSTDGSDEVLAPYARALPLTIVPHRQRQGYGRSLEELLRTAVARTDRPRRDMAVTIQADFSDAPETLIELVKRLESGADIAVADARRSPTLGRAGSLARRLLPVLARAAVKVPGAADLVGTMRAYRLATIERLVREAGNRPFITRDGWAADLELLVRAARHARRVESVPTSGTRFEGARASRRRHLADAWRALRTAFALRDVPQPGSGAPPRQETETPELRDCRPKPRQGADQRRGRGGAHRHAAGEPRQPAPQAPAGAPTTAPPQGERKRRGRRRRGRGRGRRPDAGPPPAGPAGPAQPSPSAA